ncbi:MAG: hypothetical protein ACODUE_09805 [Synechococcus sp.]
MTALALTPAPALELCVDGQRLPLLAFQADQLRLLARGRRLEAGDCLRAELMLASPVPTLPFAPLGVLLVVLASPASGPGRICRLEPLQPQDRSVLQQLAHAVGAGLVSLAAPPTQPRPPSPRWLPLLLLLVAPLPWLAQQVLRSATSLRLDQAVVGRPPGPVQPILEAVAAPRQGLVGQLFVAEGAAVAPGQPLFTLQPDPRLDQDLLDRALSRDIDNVDNRLRQAELRVLELQDRLAQSRLEQRASDPAGAAVAVAALASQERTQQQVLLRRRQLLREGAVTADDVDGTAIRLAEVTARLQDSRRQASQERLRSDRTTELRRSLQREQGRLAALDQRLRGLRGQEESQRRLAADQPRSFSEASLRARSLYGTVRASLRGVVVRILRDSGNPVRPRETVLILQRDQPPPVVVALAPGNDARQLRPGQRGEVEIPALRRRFIASVSELTPPSRPGALAQVQMTLVDPPAEELSRLAALRGAPAVVVLPNRSAPLQLLPF